KKINDNAYKIELPGHYNVSATFNVADLFPYKGDSDDEVDSGSSLFQEGEDDADAVNEQVNVTNTLGAYCAHDPNQLVEILLVIIDEQLVLDMMVDEPLVLDEQLVQSMIVGEVMLYMVVVVEDMCRIIVVEELLKTVDCTEVDCTKVEDCCRMKVSCMC
ncbi:hypothetical protein Tco_1196129, partial [Tanacetum coccineum]